MSYLPCELHCHTVHSDGSFSVTDLLRNAYDDHLALIALTDHNTTSGHAELDDTITPAIRGIEWTTYFGHMLVLGARDFVDWRDAVPENIDEKIRRVKEVGGVVGIAHPFQLGAPMCTGGRWEFDVHDWNNVDYMEIWHEAFSDNNYENEAATAYWKSLLDKGYRIAATYGRDWHRNSDAHFGATYLDINGEVCQENALDAIRGGRTVVSYGAKFFFRVHRWGSTYYIGDTFKKGHVVFSFFTDLHARRKDEGDDDIKYQSIRIVTNGNRCVLETAVTERLVRLSVEAGHWYCCELWGSVNGKKQMLAVTSPIYTEK